MDGFRLNLVLRYCFPLRTWEREIDAKIAAETDADLARALAEPLDLAAWDVWYAAHGSRRAGVFFARGHIPSVVDSVRYGIFRRQGLPAMLSFDATVRLLDG